MRDVERRAANAYRLTFDQEPEIVVSAPGRVNLIGEHTDHNDGFVLPCAIDRRIAVALGTGTGGLLSTDFGERQSLNGCRADGWVAYPRGIAWVLAERGYTVPPFQAAYAGDVPIGAGLSSSAAIEAATALALDALFHLNFSRKELAVLSQQAENGFVGVNSGIMDQYASLLCREGEALLVDCRSLEARGVPIDLEAAGLLLVVCDTRVKRELAHTGYNDRRAATERASRALGLPNLRDATIADLARLDGVELRRARHVITENARVLEAVDALEQGDFAAFGALMVASHFSLRDDYEVSTPELNTFVSLALERDALGARLTGAGFGGCAIALVPAGALDALRQAVDDRFRDEGFSTPDLYIFHPSAGAEIA